MAGADQLRGTELAADMAGSMPMNPCQALPAESHRTTSGSPHWRAGGSEARRTLRDSARRSLRTAQSSESGSLQPHAPVRCSALRAHFRGAPRVRAAARLRQFRPSTFGSTARCQLAKPIMRGPQGSEPGTYAVRGSPEPNAPYVANLTRKRHLLPAVDLASERLCNG
jgi:hypothetical protein